MIEVRSKFSTMRELGGRYLLFVDKGDDNSITGQISQGFEDFTMKVAHKGYDVLKSIDKGIINVNNGIVHTTYDIAKSMDKGITKLNEGIAYSTYNVTKSIDEATTEVINKLKNAFASDSQKDQSPSLPEKNKGKPR